VQCAVASRPKSYLIYIKRHAISGDKRRNMSQRLKPREKAIHATPLSETRTALNNSSGHESQPLQNFLPCRWVTVPRHKRELGKGRKTLPLKTSPLNYEYGRFLDTDPPCMCYCANYCISKLFAKPYEGN